MNASRRDTAILRGKCPLAPMARSQNVRLVNGKLATDEELESHLVLHW